MPPKSILTFAVGIVLLTAVAVINQHVVAQRPEEQATAMIERARPIYAAKCAECHGPRMEGGRHPGTGNPVTPLDKFSYRIYFYGMPATTEGYVTETIKIGAEMMPAFAGSINDKDRLALAVLIRVANTGSVQLP